MFYVDQGLFGQGRLVQDDNNLNQYQLTCYERKVPQVDWYDQGVVYQIFPDRFANGNRSQVARKIASCTQPKKIRHITSEILEEKLRAGTFLVAI